MSSLKEPKRIGGDGVKNREGDSHAGKEVSWRTSRFSLKSGVIGIRGRTEELAGHVALREGAVCTLPEVIRVVDRPQEIENDAAMSFLGEKRAMPTRVRGRLSGAISGRKRAERWHARLVVF